MEKTSNIWPGLKRGLVPKGGLETTLAALLATGLIGGPLASALREDTDPEEIRKPHHLKIYLKKRKKRPPLPVMEEEDELNKVSQAAGTPSLDPEEWGKALKYSLMAGATPLAAMGLYNIWSAFNEARERAKVEAKLRQLERGAIPKVKPRGMEKESKDAFMDGFIEKLSEGSLLGKGIDFLKRVAEDPGREIRKLYETATPDVLERGLMHTYLPAVAATGGLGALLGYGLGRKYWKYNKPKSSVVRDPVLDVSYIDPETGEVWGEEERPDI